VKNMGRKIGYAGVLAGCLGSAFVLRAGISSPAAMPDNADSALVAACGVLSMLGFLLAADLLKSANWKGVLHCGAALTVFSLLGIMTVGSALLPGAMLILVPAAIHMLENRGETGGPAPDQG
jgi:hypothetical protein